MAQIKVNRKNKPTTEQIRKHKDFNQFVKGYKQFTSYRGTRLLYKKRRLFTVIIVVIVLILILLFEKLG